MSGERLTEAEREMIRKASQRVYAATETVAAVGRILADRARAAVPDETLAKAVGGIETHNGTPITPENLRYAATHPAMSGSWIFDVLTGLADAIDRAARSSETGEGES